MCVCVCRRSKEYAQAVERYTLSLGYNPDSANVYGNRAAAYFKLKMYPEVRTRAHTCTHTRTLGM